MNATLSQLDRAVGHPPLGVVNSALASQIVDLLNDLYRLDPSAMHDLIETRVRCNPVFAAHPTVPVQAPEDGDGGLVGILGLLNGLCGSWTQESAPRPHLAFFGPVCAIYDDHGRLQGFALSEERLQSRPVAADMAK